MQSTERAGTSQYCPERTETSHPMYGGCRVAKLDRAGRLFACRNRYRLGYAIQRDGTGRWTELIIACIASYAISRQRGQHLAAISGQHADHQNSPAARVSAHDGPSLTSIQLAAASCQEAQQLPHARRHAVRSPPASPASGLYLTAVTHHHSCFIRHYSVLSITSHACAYIIGKRCAPPGCEVRIIETRCIGICPKKAVTAVNASHPGKIFAVPVGTPPAEVLKAIAGPSC